MRLDQYLHANGHTPSRERARALIMAGIVYVNGGKADKAGTPVPDGATVEVRGNDLPYVSRGGLKLEKALRVFSVNLQNKICMDVGASTGGFTDCMLQNGAAKVYAVDVGYGQLAWTLRNDPRVVVMERTNIRHVTAEQVSDAISFFTVDVSFISLKLVLPVLAAITSATCEGVCLVKPQFEAGREKVGKKGVVRELSTRVEVLHKAVEYAHTSGFSTQGLDYSPVKGPEGNIEFLLYLRKGGSDAVGSEKPKEIAEAAHQALEPPS